MYNCIICRYHEIATKGNNRFMFERCLAENIKHRLRETVPGCKVHRVRGRIWIDHADGSDFTAEELSTIRPILAETFGLESFSPARRLPVDMEAIRHTVLEMVTAEIGQRLAAKAGLTFRVRARRSNKSFSLHSQEIEIDLVTLLAQKFGDDAFKIDLKNAEITLGCEVRDEFAILFWHQFDGPGGLPVGSNPKVLTLLSGGIDSPVAAYLLMKRGCATDFITFHSAPYTPPETVEKVRRLAEKLNTFQSRGALHLCNLSPLQKLIRDYCDERLRTVLYRRAMLRIAEQVAHDTHCNAIVTGDAVGQVASQTIHNMNTINRAVEMLVLRPLCGMDKLEAIELARKIDTLELSNEQVPDSCTVFAPRHPSTAVSEAEAVAEEQKIPEYREVLKKIITDIETIA